MILSDILYCSWQTLLAWAASASCLPLSRFNVGILLRKKPSIPRGSKIEEIVGTLLYIWTSFVLVPWFTKKRSCWREQELMVFENCDRA